MFYPVHLRKYAKPCPAKPLTLLRRLKAEADLSNSMTVVCTATGTGIACMGLKFSLAQTETD